MKNTAIILAQCPDQKGIVAGITDFLVKNNGNIVAIDQYVDPDANHFFIRVEWELEGFRIPQDKTADYFNTLIARPFDMTFDIFYSDTKPKIAIMVSKYTHCLYDLLARYEAGEWEIEIVPILSNHTKCRPIADRVGIPFYHFPISKETKATQEDAEIALLDDLEVDLIILARYMQILSAKFIDAYREKIINIHHSSLPAFVGANPYASAHSRGVKIMGATAHYVTEDLDEGPIIGQDVISISHKDAIADMKRKGQDIEKIVLARAVYDHIHHRVLIHKNKTVIF